MSDGHGPHGREIDDYLLTLRERCEARNGSPVDLDWDRLSTLFAQSAWIGVVVNSLLRGFGDVNLKVDLPDEAEALEPALGAGLPFAFVNRSGEVEIDGSEEASELLCSSVWRRSWTPATRSAWVGLLGESPPGLSPAATEGNGDGNGSGHSTADAIGRLFGASHAMFVNPHRSRRFGSSESVFPLISRWLSKETAGVNGEEATGTGPPRDKLLTAVRILLDELIQNVRGHATDRSGSPVFCLVKVATETETEEPCAWISVQDTGPGILATLKPKLEDGGRPDKELLSELLRGELQPWQAARGIGLPKVWRTCRELGAELNVASGSVRFRSAGDDWSCELVEFESPGALITAKLPLSPTS